MDPPVRRGKKLDRTEILTLRISKQGMAAVDEQAEHEDRNRSDMVRLLLQRGLAASR
jgi:hypothetical protein